MSKEIIKINKAEGIFLPMFDVNLNDASEFTAQNAVLVQSWDCCMLTGKSETFGVTWNGMVDMGEYDRLLFFINPPPYVKVGGTAIVNGEEIKLFENVFGANAPIEIAGTVSADKDGKRILTSFTLTFDACGSAISSHIISLGWVGVLCSDKEHLIEDALPKYDEHSFDNYLIHAQPDLRDNVFYGQKELDAMIEKARADIRMKPAFEQLAKKAAAYENFVPEKEIRQYLAVKEHMYRYVRVRDRNRLELKSVLTLMAVAGYVHKNPKWTMLAARMLLSIAVTPFWFEGPQANMPGSNWHHVCFTEEGVCREITYALGFLGGVLTEEAKKRILVGMKKHFPTIERCCDEVCYRRFMNQGVVESSGRAIAALGLKILGDDEYAGMEKIESYYRQNVEIVNNYLNEEGHCCEGPGYYFYSFNSSFTLWMAYARMKGVPVKDIVPDRVLLSFKYLECLFSRAKQNEDFVYTNSWGNKRQSPFLIAAYARYLGFEAGMAHVEKRLAGNPEELEIENSLNFIMLCDFIAHEKPVPQKMPPEWVIFEKSGLASYEFDKGKFWYFAERNPMTCHYHGDRGSFILHYADEALFADPGIVSYNNAMSRHMVLQTYHNVAYPTGRQMKIKSEKADGIASDKKAQANGTLVLDNSFWNDYVPEIKYLKKTKNGLAFCSDQKALFPGIALKGERAGEFSENGLVFTDTWELTHEDGLTVNFVSYGKWEITDHGASVRVGKAAAVLKFETDLKISLATDTGMIDAQQRPITVLRLMTEPAKEIRVKTEIKFFEV